MTSIPKRSTSSATAITKRKIKRGNLPLGDNLYLRTTETGTKSYLFRFAWQGKDRWLGLGSINLVTREEARAEALRCRKLAHQGIDPAEDRKARVGAVLAARSNAKTFKQHAEAHIDAHEPSWKNSKHASQWRSTMATYVYPKIGELPIRSIQTPHVLACIEPIWSEKTETASRVRGRIEDILGSAAAEGLRDEGFNPATWKGHLEHRLPARGKVRKTKHHAALPYADVPAFYRRLCEIDNISAAALRYVLLTNARTTEVIGARWSEVDLQQDMWVVPAERMKAGRAWRVPLARQTVALLHELEQDGDLIFASPRTGGQLSNMAMLALLRGMQMLATVHGFRSSFKDWCAETQQFAHEVSEMALAHAVGSKVEQAYRRGDLVEKRRECAQAWADFVCGKKAKRLQAAKPQKRVNVAEQLPRRKVRVVRPAA